MMDELLTIYVDRLRDGHTEKFNGECSSNFLDVCEDGLSFSDTVYIRGEAYLVDQRLLVHLNAKTQALLPCVICNEDATIHVEVRDFCLFEEVSDIKTGKYNFGDQLREALLLEIPSFAECNGGQCPCRVEIKKYLAHSKDNADVVEGRYHPFANLNIN